jgi:hypothetical protein
MKTLEHPLKAEMEAVRAIIIKASSKITEDFKWGGPSYFYKEDMATINPKIKNYVAVIFHQGSLIMDDSGMFEEATKGKAYAKFYSMDDVTKHKTALTKAVKSWITIMDKK